MIDKLVIGKTYRGREYDIVVEKVFHDEKLNFMKATVRKTEGEFSFTGPTVDLLVDTVKELFSEIEG